MRFTVAIDGPAAAGKGTVARALAAHFGFAYLDTGMLYRAVAARMLEAAGGFDESIAAAISGSLNEKDLNRPDLRLPQVADTASRVAVLPSVRDRLLSFQRRFANQEGGAVLDGRDIGTVVCPQAEVKLFVTASPEVRAHRRWLEDGGSEAEVLEDVLARDRRDRERVTAPMKPAEDAILLDTSSLSVDEVGLQARAIVAARLAAAAGEARA